MAKQVVDVRPGTGISRGQSNEHLRNYKVTDPERKIYGYYDPTREHLNFEVGKGGVIKPVNKLYSLDQRFRDNLRNRGMEDPNRKKIKEGKEPNRRTLAHIILGGSREQMQHLAFGDQQVDFSEGADNRMVHRQQDIEQWAKDTYNFVVKKYGEENIVAFVVHLDERNPHVHLTLIPVNEKGKISWNDRFGSNKEKGREKYLELHNEFAEVNRKYGLDRGDDIRETGAKHRTSEEYWLDLRNKCNNLENDVSGKKQELQILDTEVKRTTIKIKGLNKMIENLNIRIADIRKELETTTQQAKQGVISNNELLLRQRQLEKELEETERKLADKKDKLQEAEKNLDKLLIMKGEADKEYVEIMRSLNRAKPEYQDQIVQKARDMAWQQVTEEMPGIVEGLKNFAKTYCPPSGQQKMEEVITDSMLQMLAEKSNETVAVAAVLFMGYIDQATTFAQSQGGGGAPTGGWGRTKDDDDDTWMRKCFHAARAMMKPVGRRLKK